MSSVLLTPTSANQTGSATAWSGISGVYQNTTPATCSLTGATASNSLNFGSWGTNLLPPNAVIQGVLFGGTLYQTSGSSGYLDFTNCGLQIGSTASGNLAPGTALPLNSGGYSFGGTNSFPSGMSGLTVADVNGGTGAGSLVVTGTIGNSGSAANAQSWGITITYTTVNQVTPQCIVIRPGYVHRD